MPAFLKEFFPEVYRKTVEEEELDSNYCKYDNEKLQLFTSCLYLAGLMATFLASHITRRQGRRATMLISGFIFIAGVAFNAAAQNLAMLIIGRVLLGSGVGFANQVILFSPPLPFLFITIYSFRINIYIYIYIYIWSPSYWNNFPSRYRQMTF